jgi:hypothetical protein
MGSRSRADLQRMRCVIRSPTGWQSRLIPKYRTLDSFWVLTDSIVQFLSRQSPLIYVVAQGVPYMNAHNAFSSGTLYPFYAMKHCEKSLCV